MSGTFTHERIEFLLQLQANWILAFAPAPERNASHCDTGATARPAGAAIRRGAPLGDGGRAGDRCSVVFCQHRRCSSPPRTGGVRSSSLALPFPCVFTVLIAFFCLSFAHEDVTIAGNSGGWRGDAGADGRRTELQVRAPSSRPAGRHNRDGTHPSRHACSRASVNLLFFGLFNVLSSRCPLAVLYPRCYRCRCCRCRRFRCCCYCPC